MAETIPRASCRSRLICRRELYMFAKKPPGMKVIASAVATVEIDNPPADRLVVLAFVLKREPTDRPGHLSAGPSLGKCIAKRLHAFRRMQCSLVGAEVLVAGRLDLIHAHDAVEREKSTVQESCPGLARRIVGKHASSGRAIAAQHCGGRRNQTGFQELSSFGALHGVVGRTDRCDGENRPSANDSVQSLLPSTTWPSLRLPRQRWASGSIE